jgi:hypothetical protein
MKQTGRCSRVASWLRIVAQLADDARHLYQMLELETEVQARARRPAMPRFLELSRASALTDVEPTRSIPRPLHDPHTSRRRDRSRSC